MDLSTRLTLRGRRRGDAIVEFALLAPVLLLLLFGILELGRVLDAWIVVQNAAREGARAAVLVYPDSATTTAAQTTAVTYLNSGFAVRGDITTSSVPSVVITSDSVQVTAAADVQVLTPMFQSLLGGSVAHVQATASMRRQ